MLFGLTPAAPSATPPATMRGAIFLPAVATPRSGALRSREIAGVWRCACACACACVCVGVYVGGWLCKRMHASEGRCRALPRRHKTTMANRRDHADTRPPRPCGHKTTAATQREGRCGHHTRGGAHRSDTLSARGFENARHFQNAACSRKMNKITHPQISYCKRSRLLPCIMQCLCV
jgi:hypothetical protein